MLEALKLDQITISDKFLLMEELWESMHREASANHFTPQWHIDILDSRGKRIEKNELSFSNIATVKERLKQVKYEN